MLDVNAGSTVLRRFAGTAADEIAIHCHPKNGSADIVSQAEATYQTLAALLGVQRTSFRDLTCETLFLRDIQRDLPLVLDARTRVLNEIGQSACAPLPAFIQQPPVGHSARFELSAWAVVPHRRDAWSMRDIRATPSCPCEGCTRCGARLVAINDDRSLHMTNIYGTGSDASEQAWNMFCAAERLLGQCGMGFRDVVRTWIHLRDIGRDYDALNTARREFFRQRGIEHRPASTGVQGIPFSHVHHLSMILHAVKSPRPLDVSPMSAPSLNEAWSYGVEFSRGLRLVEANKTTLYISGTASIDEGGRTVHVGELEAQADRMLHNIASLLAQHNATFENVISGVMYVRSSSDAPVLRARCHERGFDGFPCAIVEAALCRPELLCESEAVAMLRSCTDRSSLGR